MSGWLLLALILVAFVVVALAILATDVARGDVGGGRHTMERARRLLVVATDDGGERWVDRHQAEHPRHQYFVLAEPDEDKLFLAVHEAIDRERPDAVVLAGDGVAIEAVHGALKEEGAVPVDRV